MLDPPPEPLSVPSVSPPVILPVQRLGALVEVVLCSGFPTQLFLIAVLTGFGMPLTTSTGLSPRFIFTLSLIDTAFVVGLIFFFLRAHREHPRTVLIGRGRVATEALVGIALMPVVFLLVMGILGLIVTFAPELHNVPRNPLEDMLQSTVDTVIFAIVVMIAGGVREEIQRGFILHRFDEFLGGGAVGVVAFSTVFGLGHLDQGIDAAIATGALGAAWGIVYLARRSIVAPMVSHAGFNLAQLLKYVALQ